jgi:hypothetical protein
MDFALTDRTTTRFCRFLTVVVLLSYAMIERRKDQVFLKIDFFLLLLKEEDRTIQAGLR